MQEITRREKDYLEQECGAKWRKHLHRTYSKHPKYYVTEDNWLLKKLDAFRKKNIIATKK